MRLEAAEEGDAEMNGAPVANRFIPPPSDLATLRLAVFRAVHMAFMGRRYR